MLTLETVTAQIAQLQSERQTGTDKVSKTHNNLLIAEIEKLKPIKLYLESKPTEDFVNREYLRLIDLKEKTIQTYTTAISAKNITPIVIKDALKNAGKPNLPEQIKTLKYILQLD